MHTNKPRMLMDHNETAKAIGDLRGLSNINQITRARGGVAVSALQRLTANAHSGKVKLVASPAFLKILQDVLMRGGGDFEALDANTARRSVSVLRQLSVRSGGFLTNAAVAAAIPLARKVVGELYGPEKGQVDYEDVTVIAHLIAATLDSDEYADWPYQAFISRDGGIHNCEKALRLFNIYVLDAYKYNQVARSA